MLATVRRVICSAPARYIFNCTVLCLMFLHFLPTPLDAARRGGKTEVLPVQTAAPVAVVIDQLGSEQELRKQLIRARERVRHKREILRACSRACRYVV